MDNTVAIHPDKYGSDASSSSIWADELSNRGFGVRWVDVYRSDALRQMRGCRAFMWRWGHYSRMRQVALRLLPVLDAVCGLVTYPALRECWHYDDKVSQYLLLAALEIPTPSTQLFFDRMEALGYLRACSYPKVVKLAHGVGGGNVALVESREQAEHLANVLFSSGVSTLLGEGSAILPRGAPGSEVIDPRDCVLARDYLFVQEYLANNPFDTRVTVVGDSVFAFRRMNRPGDFRASGSGCIDYATDAIDERFVRLAWQTARKTRMRCVAIDGLYDASGSPVVSEISYTFASAAVAACPGRWIISGIGDAIEWAPGRIEPERLQVELLLNDVQRRA